MLHVKMNVWNKKEAKELFQELPLYKTFIETPRIKLPFYDKLNIKQLSKTFKKYTRSYKIEIIDSKDPLAQLEASKSSVKDLFKDLLDKIKEFKHQIKLKVFFKKHKENGDIEFDHICFNSTTKTTKTVINSKCDLDKILE